MKIGELLDGRLKILVPCFQTRENGLPQFGSHFRAGQHRRPCQKCHVIVLPRGHQAEDIYCQKFRAFFILDDRLTFRNIAATVLLETVELVGGEDEGGDGE
jgi:hypothetical protein